MARRPVGKLDPGMFDRLRLGWRLLRDPRIPAWPKWIVPIVAAIYVFSPIDALPDVLPLLGWTDDMGMIALALALVTMLMRWSPREIVDEHATNLGLYPDLERVMPERGPFGATAKPKQEPIEAQYWVDDWR